MKCRQAGFTLLELMVVTAVLAIFAGMALGLGTQAHRDHAVTTGYQRDLEECRAVLRALEADLRAARSVAVDGGSVAIERTGGPVEYQHREGGLWRCDASGRRRLARCIAALAVTRERRLVRVELVIRARSRRDARVVSWVALRNGEAR